MGLNVVNRALVVIALAGGLMTLFAIRYFYPAYFNHLTKAGYVIEGGRDIVEVISNDKLSHDTREKANRICLPNTFQEIPINLSVETIDEAMENIGYNQKVICKSRSDRTADWLNYILCFIVFPILVFIGKAIVGWIMRGKASHV